jgi:hypothetical protein
VTNVDDVRRALGLAAKPPALTVQCPHCRAGPGDPCTTRGRRRQQPHPGRIAAAPDATVIAFPATEETRNA